MPDIPIIDLAPALDGDPEGEAAAARRLDDVYSSVGFGQVVGHGIDRSLVDDLFSASRRFHGLAAQDKLAVALNDAHRGYIAMATSTIVTSSVEVVRRPNQSESFMVMHELADDHPDRLAGAPLAGPNQWPAAAPDIRRPIEAYVEAVAGLGRRLVRIIALALGAPRDHLDAAFAEPVTFLRLLWYPPQPPDSPEDLYGSAPHTDYGFITLLAQHRLPGLQVRRAGGAWIDVPAVEDAFVLNSADILHRWSNGRWVSTPHRVINRTGEERYSAPFFFDPGMDTVVAPLPWCVADGHGPSFEPVVYGEYLMDRLRANYRRHQQPGA
jgi:isopenicillin N synthase-like dioxygenase